MMDESHHPQLPPFLLFALDLPTTFTNWDETTTSSTTTSRTSSVITDSTAPSTKTTSVENTTMAINNTTDVRTSTQSTVLPTNATPFGETHTDDLAVKGETINIIVSCICVAVFLLGLIALVYALKEKRKRDNLIKSDSSWNSSITSPQNASRHKSLSSSLVLPRPKIFSMYLGSNFKQV